MGEKLKPSVDFKEITQFGHPIWLSGFLEIGSGMFFERRMIRKKGRETPYAFPVISFGDDDVKRLEILKRIVDGRLKPSKHSRNIQLLVEADKASWLAYSIKPYAPSRKEIINGFLAWSAADITEDRVVIAKQFRGRRIISPASTYDYINLVQIPEFVGGIIDGRGGINHKEVVKHDSQVSWIHENVIFRSINGPLLDALYSQFGGYLHITNHAGDTVNIRGESIVLKNDSAQWTIGSEMMNDIVSWAKPMLPLSNALLN